MTVLFGRTYALVIGTLDVSNLDFAFKVKKNLKPIPNTCEIQVWNLTQSHRKQIETAPQLNVSLEAGYQGDNTLLYLGQVRSAHTRMDGCDIVTEVSTGDSEKKIATSRINVPIGAKTSLQSALNSIASALGVGNGNIASVANMLQSKGIVTMYPSGTVLSGNVAQELTNFCKTAQLNWSIQDGVLTIQDLNKPLNQQAVVLSPETGLLDSPTFEVDKQVINAKCLLIPDLIPGRVVEFQTANTTGQFYITQVEYVGATDGDDWTANLTCKKY